MMSTLPPIVSLMLLVGTVAAGVWIGAEVMRRMSGRGTRPRWYWAGIERASRYPAGIYLAISAAVSFSYSDPVYGTLQTIGLALWGSVLLEKKNGDQDDDFWTQVGDWLKGTLTGRRTAWSAG